MEKILIIEDEESMVMVLKDDLELEGYEVESVKDGLQGLSMAKEGDYDLIILDIILPNMNGFEICRQLRQVGVGTPILMLSAGTQGIDKVLGLELGADDYVTKPFNPRELLARVKAILRRVRQYKLEEETSAYQFGDVKIDFRKYEASKNGKPVYLTQLEFALIRFFIEHRDEALNRYTILDEVWDEDVHVLSRTVDTHVGHLRKKLEDDPASPKYIINVRGVGYKFTT
jgi:DNA-binding response OmpR family regulator